MKWTEEKIPNLTGKIIVVTGANSGIGFEATRLFAKNEATIIMAIRSMSRGEAAFDRIKKEFPSADLALMTLDLGSFDSIRSFAEAFHKKYNRLDILLNNAGIMSQPFGKTADGLEQQQGVNHFGHFLLTKLLFEKIQQSEDGRIVSVSSLAHMLGTMKFSNLFYEKGGYREFSAYGRSKLENLLFTNELASRLDQAGIDNVKAVAVHPGIATTNLGAHIKSTRTYKIFHTITNRFSHDAYTGCLASVRACVDPDVQNGEFYGPDGLFKTKGYPQAHKPFKKAKNKEHMIQLWRLSEDVVGDAFNIKKR